MFFYVTCVRFEIVKSSELGDPVWLAGLQAFNKQSNKQTCKQFGFFSSRSRTVRAEILKKMSSMSLELLQPNMVQWCIVTSQNIFLQCRLSCIHHMSAAGEYKSIVTCIKYLFHLDAIKTLGKQTLNRLRAGVFT